MCSFTLQMQGPSTHQSVKERFRRYIMLLLQGLSKETLLNIMAYHVTDESCNACNAVIFRHTRWTLENFEISRSAHSFP